MQEDMLLEAVRHEAGQWVAEFSFRGKRHRLRFLVDGAARLRPADVGRSPFALTIEGHEIGLLVDRVRSGDAIALPRRVEPGPTGPRLPSVHDRGWTEWKEGPGPAPDVWLEGVERLSDARWLARLRHDGRPELFEVHVLPGEVLEEVRGPNDPSFQPYKYDLLELLLDLHHGGRVELPRKLRRRGPARETPASSERSGG